MNGNQLVKFFNADLSIAPEVLGPNVSRRKKPTTFFPAESRQPGSGGGIGPSPQVRRNQNQRT